MNDQDSVRLPKKWDDDDEARALMETALELMDEINKGASPAKSGAGLMPRWWRTYLSVRPIRARSARKNYDMNLVFPPDCVRRQRKLPR